MPRDLPTLPRVASFRGSDMPTVFALASGALGEDAVVLRTHVHRAAPPAERVEMVAAPAADVERFRSRLMAMPLALPDRAPGGARPEQTRPLVVAFVGPSGGGKTTALTNLAVQADAFGERRVGVVTLDADRPGALERLQTFVAAAQLPAEVVYDRGDVDGALRRLARCDVILVDTPGLGPRAEELNRRWSASLAALRPDEVHLVVAAGLRPELAAAARARFAAHGATHALVTKLDELPDDRGVAEVAAAIGLPVRWLSDGDLLRPAAARLLASLGMATSAAPSPATVGRAMHAASATPRRARVLLFPPAEMPTARDAAARCAASPPRVLHT